MVLRLSLALGILTGLFYFVDLRELFVALLQIDLFYLLLLILLAVIMIWASCLKWRLFLRSCGSDAPMIELMRLYTVGYFFNTFTPSYVGGDLARSYHLGKSIDNQRDALISTFLERFTGFLAMALLGVTFVVLGTEVTAGLTTAILLVGAFAVLLATACFSPRIGALMFQMAGRVLELFGSGAFIQKVSGVLRKMDQGMNAARGNPKLLFHALLLSLFFHCLTVVNTYVAAKAIGWDQPDLSGLFIVVPLVLLVSMAPVTPSGLGIQEGAFLFLLQRIGATQAQGLAVGILLRAKVMLLALFGGLLWVRVRKNHSVSAETISVNT